MMEDPSGMMAGMPPPHMMEGMIFQDGAYFVPHPEGGYARLPSPLDNLVTPTTPDVESTISGLGARTQAYLAAGDRGSAKASLRTARRLVHGNEAISERARAQLTAAIDNSQAVYAMACGHPHTALRYLERALALNLHDGNDGSLATTCMNLTAVLSHLRHHDRALKLAEAAILLTAEETDPAVCAAAYFNLAVQQEVMARGPRGDALRRRAIESYATAKALSGVDGPAALAKVKRVADDAIVALREKSASEAAKVDVRVALHAQQKPCGLNTVPPEGDVDSNLPRVKLFEAAFEECRPGRNRAKQQQHHHHHQQQHQARGGGGASPRKPKKGPTRHRPPDVLAAAAAAVGIAQKPTKPDGGAGAPVFFDNGTLYPQRPTHAPAPAPGRPPETGAAAAAPPSRPKSRTLNSPRRAKQQATTGDPAATKAADATHDEARKNAPAADHEDEYLRTMEDELNSYTAVPLQDLQLQDNKEFVSAATTANPNDRQ